MIVHDGQVFRFGGASLSKLFFGLFVIPGKVLSNALAYQCHYRSIRSSSCFSGLQKNHDGYDDHGLQHLLSRTGAEPWKALF